MGKHRILYLPVETTARELLGKTFLAARAVERGWVVVMGDADDVRRYMMNHPRGVFAIGSIPEKKTDRLQKLCAAGHRVADLCEENLVYAEGRDYCDRKMGREALQWVDCLLVSGERNARDIRSFRPSADHKIKITGNPRFDTLFPSMRVVYERQDRKLRAENRPFILVNTSFGRANPYGGKDVIASLQRQNAVAGPEHEAYLRRSIEDKRRRMIGLQNLVAQLSKEAGKEIVIRPHPAENHQVWKDWARKFANVEVHYRGSANEWMNAAYAVIHAGCTTGIEGLLLDRPVFSYVPEPDSEFLNPADEVSQPVADASECIEQLAAVRNLDRDGVRDYFKAQRERLKYYLANTEPPFAADRIMDALEELDLPEATGKEMGFPTSVIGHGLQRMYQSLAARSRPSEKALPPKKLQKFPGIDRGDMALPLDKWVKQGVLARPPRLTRLGGRLWAIH